MPIKQNITITINNKVIIKKECIKYIGVLIDSNIELEASYFKCLAKGF